MRSAESQSEPSEPRLRGLVTELLRAHKQSRGLLRHLPIGLIVYTDRGSVWDCNIAARRLLGLEIAHLHGDRPLPPGWRAFLHVEDALSPAALSNLTPLGHVRDLLVNANLSDDALTVIRADGSRQWLRLHRFEIAPSNALMVNGPKSPTPIRCYALCLVDHTPTVAQQQMLATTVEAARLGVWSIALQTGYVDRNAMCWRMLGYEPAPDQATMADWYELVHPDDTDNLQEALAQCANDPQKPLRLEYRIKAASGNWAWLLAVGAVVELDENNVALKIAGVHMDITERKTLETALSSAARTDALTGLPNRTALCEWLQKSLGRLAWTADYHVAILFMDFDRFKLVNDSLGHSAGDELLRQIAQRLRSEMRGSDAIGHVRDSASSAARLGGDEFVVLLDGLRHPEHAQVLAERLLDALKQPYNLGGTRVQNTASIGIVCVNAQTLASRSADDLLRDADTAMYEAKARGRGCYVLFSEDMQERAQRSMKLDGHLRIALSRPNNPGLRVVYQPIVNIQQGQVVGMEALLRWSLRGHGEISPIEFVALAEEHGMIEALGAYVLGQACQTLGRMRQEMGDFAPGFVSINISRRQLLRGDLPGLVRQAIQFSGLEPHMVHLEVTESTAAQPSSLAALAQLREIGVHISMDDFGTGYSSMGQLDKMPLDIVKLDRSFVQGVEDQEFRIVLVDCVLRLARALHLAVIAEGIETAAQARILNSMGCQLGQGYFYSEPMDETAFLQWLRDHQEISSFMGLLEPPPSLLRLEHAAPVEAIQ